MGVSKPSRRDIGVIAGIVAAHVVLTFWGLELVAPPEDISLMWLPDGFLLGCLVLLPLRLWPWTVGAVAPAVVLVELTTTDRPVATIALFLLANLAESVGGAAILRGVGAGAGFRTFRQLGVFIGFCVVALPAGSAAIGALGVEVQDASADFWSVYRTWFSSAGLGILFVAPLVIHGYLELRDRRAAREPLIERQLGLLLVLTVAVGLLSGVIPSVSGVPVTLLFVSLPLLIWSALRFGAWGALTVSSCLVLVLVHLTAFGNGPFSDDLATSSQAVVRLQSYLSSAIIATMFTALATERSREARAELEQSLDRYSAMFNHSPVSLWEEDLSAVKTHLDQAYDGPPDGLAAWLDDHPDEVATCARLVRILAVNSHTYQLFEADEGEFTARLHEFFDEESLRVFKQALVALASGHRLFRTEAKQLTLQGRPILTLTNIALAPGAEDDWSRVLVAIEDVTERRQAEKALRHAQKMEAIGQMAGGIAHDFNNVLTVILGNLEMVDDDSNLAAEARTSVRTSRRAAERAAELTRQLLGFSRQPSADDGVFDAIVLVKGMSNLVERSITPAISVDYRLSDDPVTIRTSRGDLEDALLNLVINARDAMPEGGRLVLETRDHRVDVEHEAATGLSPGDYVRITVADSGVGMPADVQERIFEPFYTTKPETKGTGLGLAMVYAFVRRSNGDVEVESQVGVGTSVHLYLPRASMPEEGAARPELQPTKTALGEETVLVVDDEPMLLRLASSLLQRLGYRVLTASNGDDALQRLGEAGTVHVLMTDIVMPGMNGYRLAQEAIGAHPGLRVMLTSGAEPVAADAPAHEFPVLAKPYTASRLADQLRSVLEAPPPAASTANA